MSYKVGMISLGCPKNQVDAEVMLHTLQQSGFTITNNVKRANVVLVNTCGFIESAKQEAIDTILECAQWKEEGLFQTLVVTGCLAERYREEILTEIPEVDAVVSLGANGKIADVCRETLQKKGGFFDGCKDLLPLNGERVLTTPSHYAYLKISEGCDNRCTYCAIPGIRGEMRSRFLENILQEAQTLAKQGVKELIVVAQDTTRYGEDIYGAPMLPKLLEGLCQVEGIRWIRLMYCYPERMSQELLWMMARQPKILRYLDLPIQHCNDRILKKMNRQGNRQLLLDTIDSIRRTLPGVVLRTTVMTGFPSETEEEFGELEEFIEDVEFDRLGCFAFSPEEGTPAYRMPEQVPQEVKLRRQESIMLKQLDITQRLLARLVGKELEVLVEGYDSEQQKWLGRSYMDAPGIDGQILFSSPLSLKKGEFVLVKITGATEYDLTGESVCECP